MWNVTNSSGQRNATNYANHYLFLKLCKWRLGLRESTAPAALHISTCAAFNASEAAMMLFLLAMQFCTRNGAAADGATLATGVMQATQHGSNADNITPQDQRSDYFATRNVQQCILMNNSQDGAPCAQDSTYSTDAAHRPTVDNPKTDEIVIGFNRSGREQFPTCEAARARRPVHHDRSLFLGTLTFGASIAAPNAPLNIRSTDAAHQPTMEHPKTDEIDIGINRSGREQFPTCEAARARRQAHQPLSVLSAHILGVGIAATDDKTNAPDLTTAGDKIKTNAPNLTTAGGVAETAQERAVTTGTAPHAGALGDEVEKVDTSSTRTQTGELSPENGGDAHPNRWRPQASRPATEPADPSLRVTTKAAPSSSPPQPDTKQRCTQPHAPNRMQPRAPRPLRRTQPHAPNRMQPRAPRPLRRTKPHAPNRMQPDHSPNPPQPNPINNQCLRCRAA